MAGEIATAYIALVPSMQDFGKRAAAQIGPQAVAVGRQAGRDAGAAFTTEASKQSENWFAHTARAAIKNVTLYGSMYAIIQKARQGVDAMMNSMIGFNAELEQSTIGFETLLGSQQAAQDQMQWIKDFAKETPFQYKELVGYSQQLIALGFNAEQARGVLEATGDAAAALGRGQESISRINLALGQMWTKGKVQSQEMLQLTEAGIGAWQILADAYGATVEQVQEAVTAGQIKAADAVPALIEGMNRQFGGLMEKQSETYTGILSNIQDTLEQQFAEAGEPLFEALAANAKEFLDALDDPEVLDMMQDFGNLLATVVDWLATGAEFAWEYRDAILAIAIAYGSMKLLNIAGSRVGDLFTAGQARLTSMREATVAANQAAQAEARYNAMLVQQQMVTRNANMAAIELAEAKAALAVADRNLSVAQGQYAAWGRTQVGLDQQVIATQTARTQAVQRLTQAEIAASAANLDLALTTRQVASADTAAAAAAQANATAQANRVKFMAGLGPMLQTAGQMAGLFGVADGIRRVSEAAQEGEVNGWGFAEAIGGGALAGAAFGSMIPGVGTAVGAVGGAFVGLTASVIAYQGAISAANRDTTIAQEALSELGVEANLAALALSGVTNDQLDAIGGFTRVLEAMKSGTYNDFIAGLQTELEGLRAEWQAQDNALAEYQRTANATNDTNALLTDEYIDMQAAVENVAARIAQLEGFLNAAGGSSEAFAAAQEQIVATAYQQAFAADMQTGALGELTKAAWDAVLAEGGLGEEALLAAARMEGLAGVAGYATQMIAGIPVGTQINFTTNAAEVMAKIVALIAARDALNAGTGDNLGGNSNSIAQRIKDLQAQLGSALVSSTPLLSLPSTPSKSGGGSAARRLADEAARAAEEAARKLERDRQAQLRFTDAFASLIESAFEGNYDQFRDRLAQQITQLTRDGYLEAAKLLEQQSAALSQVALDYAALTNKLKAATNAYDDLIDKMQQQYEASRNQILGLADLKNAQSFDQLAYLLGETTARATEYQSILEQLKDMGLSEELWNQLAQAGPESMSLAASILAQGQEGVDQLNSLSEGLTGAAESMGETVANSMYGQGVAAMEAYIEGLKSQQSALEAQLETIANNVMKKVAGAITPGNAGYSPIVLGSQETVNNYNITVSAESLSDLEAIKRFIEQLEQAPTTQVQAQAGQVVS